MHDSGVDFGREDQPSAGDRIVETCLPHAINREEQPVAPLIPDRDRENSSEQIEGALPVVFPRVGDDFSV